MKSLLVEAENAVRARRIRLYLFKPSGRRRWVVAGRRGEYLVLPDSGYCSCHDFFFRVISGEKPTCYHLMAVKLARRRGAYDVIEKEDRWHDSLMSEWLGRKKSPLI